MFRKNIYITHSSGSSYDSDAQAYFTAVEGDGNTLTTTEKDAWNDFVIGAKSDGFYSNLIAAYPLMGGNASGQKYNAIDPQNTDGALRLTFGNTPIHTSNGFSSGYGDTHWVPENDGTAGDFSMGIYVSGNVNGLQGSGADDNAGNRRIDVRPRGSNFFTCRAGDGSAGIGGSNTDSNGFFCLSSTTTTAHKAFKNGVQVGPTNTSDQSGSFNLISFSVYFGSVNQGGTAVEEMTTTVQFGYLSSGLSDAQVTNFNTRIETFMDARGIGVQ